MRFTKILIVFFFVNPLFGGKTKIPCKEVKYLKMASKIDKKFPIKANKKFATNLKNKSKTPQNLTKHSLQVKLRKQKRPENLGP